MKKQQPLNIILLGDIASGKGTQSKLLVKQFPLHDFDMGKLLRKIPNKKIRVMDKGNLAPTVAVQKILLSKIPTYSKTKGILFDGHPKMASEARLTTRLLQRSGRNRVVVLYLTLPKAEIYKRTLLRKRADDTPTHIKKRLSLYKNNITQAVRIFKKSYPFTKVSGLGSIPQVNHRILTAITKLAIHG